MISGGYNIYPKEIESVLDGLEGVDESAVVGAPHGDLGEGIVAFVVPAETSDKTSLDESDILAALDGLLARFKQPRKICLVDALPRNTMGKVQKVTLREQVVDIFVG